MNNQNTKTNIEQGKGLEPIHQDNGDSGKSNSIMGTTTVVRRSPGTIYVIRRSPVNQKLTLVPMRVSTISAKKNAQHVCSSKENATRIIGCRRIR